MRYERHQPATELEMAQVAGWAHSILPREDIQYLMGDDLLILAAIKALRIIEQWMAGHKARGADQIEHDIYLHGHKDEEKKDEMTGEEDIYGA